MNTSSNEQPMHLLTGDDLLPNPFELDTSDPLLQTNFTGAKNSDDTSEVSKTQDSLNNNNNQRADKLQLNIHAVTDRESDSFLKGFTSKEVVLPKGSLLIAYEKGKGSPVVTRIAPNSPLKGKIRVGMVVGKLILNDGTVLMHLSPEELVAKLKQTENTEGRKMLFMNPMAERLTALPKDKQVVVSEAQKVPDKAVALRKDIPSTTSQSETLTHTPPSTIITLDDDSPPTPPIPSPPPPFWEDDDDWQQLYSRVENSIIKAEEKYLMEKIGRSIDEAEKAEKKSMERDQNVSSSPISQATSSLVGSNILYLSTASEDVNQNSSYDDELMKAQWSELSSMKEFLNETGSPDDTQMRRSHVMDEETAEPSVVEVTKIIPKFAGLNGSEPLLSKKRLKEEVVNVILNDKKLSFHPEQSLVATITSHPHNSQSSVLYCRGHPLLLREFKHKIDTVMRRGFLRHNIATLFADKESTVFDLRVDCKTDLGMILEEANNKPGHPNLWHSKSRGKNVESSIPGGSIILKIDDKICLSLTKLKRQFQKARKERRDVKVTICTSKDTDLQPIFSKNPKSLWKGTKTRRLREEKIDMKLSHDAIVDNELSDSSIEVVENAPPTSSNSRSKKQTENYEAYNKFVVKYKDVREIEYQNSGIHAQFVKHHMWEKHKQLGYSTLCDDNCTCAFHLDHLTEGLVGEYIKKNEKKGDREKLKNLREGISAVGFVDNFAAKFMSKLKQEYPKESPSKLLDRLVGMWPSHKGNIQFGLQCRKDCRCGEGWEVVFKKGCQKTDHVAPTTFRRKPLLGSHVPRRGSGTSGIGNKVSSPQFLPYWVEFNSQKPLGFFCVTERKSGFHVCKISSVNPHNIGRDLRIHKGTIVRKVSIGDSAKKPISSHLDLKKFYENCKRKNSRIQLEFINTDVEDDQSRDHRIGFGRDFSKDWKKSGAWQGSVKLDGWAGGAQMGRPVGHKALAIGAQGKVINSFPETRTTSTVAASTATSHRAQGDAQMGKLVGHKAPAIPGQGIATSTVAANTAISRRAQGDDRHIKIKPQRKRSVAPMNNPSERLRSLLRKSKHTSKTAIKPGASFGKERSLRAIVGDSVKDSPTRVKFAKDLVEKRFYVVDSIATTYLSETEMLECAGNDIGGSDLTVANTERHTTDTKSPPQRKVPRKTALLDAALQKYDYKEVIELLKAGVDGKDECKQRVNTEMKNLMKQQQSRPADHMLDEKVRNLDLIYKSLKVFITADHIIEEAKCLKSYVCYQIQLVKINNLRLTPKGISYTKVHKALSIRFQSEGKQKKLPVVTFAETVSYAQPPLYTMSYNERKKDDELEIYLALGESEGSRPSEKLGKFRISVQEIKKAIEDENGMISSDIVTGEYCCSGTILINARMVHDDTRKNEKIRDIARHARDVIIWIDRFNHDTGHQWISGHIVSPKHGNLSLLHAAIYLQKLDLVKDLVRIGADERAQSSVGTPYRLAENMEGYKKSVEIIDLCDNENDVHQHELERSAHSDIIDYFNEIREKRKDDAEKHKSRHENKHEISPGDSFTSNSTITKQIDRPAIGSSKKQHNQFHGQKLHKESDERNISRSKSTGREFENAGSDSPKRTITKASSKEDSDTRLGRHKESEKKRKRENSPTRRDSGNTRVSDVSLQPSDLPKLSNPEFLTTKGKKSANRKCSFYNSPRGCLAGSSCRFVHVKPRVGEDLDGIDNLYNSNDRNRYMNPTCAVRMKGLDVNGARWWTAGYDDRENNIAYYAERGQDYVKSSQGLCWYPSEASALAALQRVGFYWWRRDNNHAQDAFPIQRSQKRHFEDSSPSEREKKRKRRESGHPFRTSGKDPEQLFHAIERADLGHVYYKITGRKLMPNAWKVTERNGLYAADFRHKANTYISTKWLRGVDQKDRYGWHKHKRSAIASAFMEFLLDEQRQGNIQDLEHTKDGRRLFI